MKIDLLYLVIPTIVQLSISYMSDLDGSGAYNIGLVRSYCPAAQSRLLINVTHGTQGHSASSSLHTIANPT